MNKVFRDIKKNWKETLKVEFSCDASYSAEQKLQLAIYEQRYENIKLFLSNFLEFQTSFKLSKLDEQYLEELPAYYFFYNSLNEINFIGPDLYVDVLFPKHTAPFVYHRYTLKERKQLNSSNIELNQNDESFLKNISCEELMRESLLQLKSNTSGLLSSYSKCFGRVLYKYTTFSPENETVVYEIRKDISMNTVSPNEGEELSLHEFSKGGKQNLKSLCIDFSNVRDNDRNHLKEWFKSFLEPDFNYYHDLVDPVGDAELVARFEPSKEAKVYKLNRKQYITLLYKYFEKLAELAANKDFFNSLLKESLENLQNTKNINQSDFDEVIKSCSNDQDIKDILEHINWDLEKYYMTRRSSDGKITEITPMGGDQSDNVIGLWKKAIFSAAIGNSLV